MGVAPSRICSIAWILGLVKGERQFIINNAEFIIKAKGRRSRHAHVGAGFHARLPINRIIQRANRVVTPIYAERFSLQSGQTQGLPLLKHPSLVSLVPPSLKKRAWVLCVYVIKVFEGVGNFFQKVSVVLVLHVLTFSLDLIPLPHQQKHRIHYRYGVSLFTRSYLQNQR